MGRHSDGENHSPSLDAIMWGMKLLKLSAWDVAYARGGGATPRRRGFREHVADDGHADEHQRDHRQPAAQAALAVGAGSVLVGTAGRHRTADSLSRGFFSRGGLRRVGAADGRWQDL